MCKIMGNFIALVFYLILSAVVSADILVSLNVNKPIHDIDEQFVSFSIAPELLYQSLDGPNKKALSLMAAMSGPSYMKLTGDFFFPTSLKSTLKNPTQAIWRGFNRWTRAMNWTMIIPVQYTPLSWDPIDALRVLNISNTVGIDNCIWQLGLDFGSSRAADYVGDLHTFDTMVDTFRPYVKSWKVIGADVTAGSSAEETKRYIEMSKDVNAAFGWTQPSGYRIEENIHGYIYDKDLSLKALMDKKVPVWLSLPASNLANQVSNGFAITEVSEAIRWASTLGDAASSGFNAIFKPLTQQDVSEPNFSFFVTALHKKIMGNRVFAPKPVKSISFASKLYTHCTNGISGGITFMTVNPSDSPIKISARLSAKYTGSEIWQFILTSHRGEILLNNEKLTVNSTLDPLVKIRHPNKPLAINMPPMSVGFWVLPLANHEDCQFTELITSFQQGSKWENRQRKQTSTDRLLKKLIFETSFTDQMKNRRRRDTSLKSANGRSTLEKSNLITRYKRFVLQEKPTSDISPLPLKERNLKKREDAGKWFRDMVMQPVANVLPVLQDWGLKRSRREANLFVESKTLQQGNLPRRTALRKKHKYTNQEDIFKKPVSHSIMQLPEGDVHLRYIQTPDGDEISDKASREEIKEERVPSRILPIGELPPEFFESVPRERYQPKPFVRNFQFEPSTNDVSTIKGQTNYLAKHFEVVSATSEKPKTTQDKYNSTKTLPGIEFTMQLYPSLPPENTDRYQEESDETDWYSEGRFRRALHLGNGEPLHDNLISMDDEELPLSENKSEINQTTLANKSTVDPEGMRTATEGVRQSVSRLINVLKNHLSGFFTSFVR